MTLNSLFEELRLDLRAVLTVSKARAMQRYKCDSTAEKRS